MCRRLFVAILILCVETFKVASTTCSPNFYWRDYSHGEIPYDALEVSSGLYIGLVHVSIGIFPAAIYPFRESAITVTTARVDVKEHIKILCTTEPEKFYWEPVNFTKVNMAAMKDAVIGGFNANYVLYIGLVYHLDSWKVGVVYDVEATSYEGVQVWANNGARVILKEFQLLKYNSSDNDNYQLTHTNNIKGE